MQTPVYAYPGAILSALGIGKPAHLAAFQSLTAGVRQHLVPGVRPRAVVAGLVDDEVLQLALHQTNIPADLLRFEKLVAWALQTTAQAYNVDLASVGTRVLLATTKANIALLAGSVGTTTPTRAFPGQMAVSLQQQLGLAHVPEIVCNACISGVAALGTGMRMLRADRAETVVVVGAEELTEFVVAGFESLQALSHDMCRPFDADRRGLNLGEGVSTIVLGTSPQRAAVTAVASLTGYASTNDANHISGPSRTGEGLYQAMRRAWADAGPMLPDYIAAHGTATRFNDDMEAQAIARMGLAHVPTASYKGFFGHTLGAAGVLETWALLQGMQHQLHIGTPGYSTPGTSHPLQVQIQTQPGIIGRAFKTAAGFGGCNAALVLDYVPPRV